MSQDPTPQEQLAGQGYETIGNALIGLASQVMRIPAGLIDAVIDHAEREQRLATLAGSTEQADELTLQITAYKAFKHCRKALDTGEQAHKARTVIRGSGVPLQAVADTA